MLETPKQDRPSGKNKKKCEHDTLDLSQINIDSRNLNISQKKSPRDSRVTSTPNIGGHKKADVKSIIKNTSTFVNDTTADSVNLDDSPSKRKKRNKSVSFMLEENEQVAVKKSKSDTLANTAKPKYKSPKKGQEADHKDKNKQKKSKKPKDAEKENQEAPLPNKHVSEENTVPTNEINKQMKPYINKSNSILGARETEQASPDNNAPETTAETKKEKKKRYKKKKNAANSENSEQKENDSNNIQNNVTETKEKKNKRKKRHLKPTESTETSGEPKNKSSKKEIVPEVVADDLKKLNIGDNTYTLTNLLDEMKVVDKNKKNKKSKKNKDRAKGKNKIPKTTDNEPTETNDIVNDLEKIEEGKEKVIWKKRKWNKDRKAVGSNEEMLLTSVIVDNLPLKIMLDYRNMLTEHFSKLGLVKNIGVAEVYPTEEPKPVFTTTVAFYSEGAATKALEEDNTVLFGGRVRIRRPLPATATTLVVRSYGDLTEQALTSAFTGAGRMRSFRQLVKGKKSIATAFVEFDGPEAVERAMKMAEDVKIGGKKIHVSRFVRLQKKTEANSGEDGIASY